MRFQDLKSRIPLQDDQLKALYNTFQEATGSEDIAQFLKSLHERGLIDAETLRSLHTTGPVELIDLITLKKLFQQNETDSSEQSAYQIQGVLGRGAMGEVHLAKALDLRRTVALKRVILENHGGKAAAEFLKEVLITAQLDHPNIVPVYRMEVSDTGDLIYSMKLIQGKTLEKLIGECRELVDRAAPMVESHTLATRLLYFLKVCEAMTYAHNRGVLHRDLKPENIMIGPFGEVYVMDWGIAQRIGDESEEDEGTSGTPAYMSPEQASGQGGPLVAYSDQYALGLILYELVSLQRAVPERGGFEEMFWKAANGHLEPLVHYADEAIPTELAAIIDKATAREPEDRYPDVSDMMDDLNRFQRGEAVLARPDTALQSLLRWISHHRETTLLIVVFLLLGVAMSVIWSLHRQQVLQQESLAREAALSTILTAVSAKATLIDEQFLNYQGILRALSASAESSIQSTPSERPYFLDGDFQDETLAPSDYEPSIRYNRDISTDWPVHKVAPGVMASPEELQRLVTLRGPLQKTLLTSSSDEDTRLDDAQIRQRIAVEGTPVVWAFVGTESGIHTAFPGKGGYPTDYDPRQRPWYKLSANTLGPRCGSPYLDAMGQGLLLPCSMALYNESGSFLGVAGLELTFRFIIDTLLELPGIEGIDHSYLLDEQGRVIVQSGTEGGDGSDEDPTLALEDFEVPEVVEAIKEQRSGYHQLGTSRSSTVVVYYQMKALGWYYAISGPEDEVL